MKLKGWHIVLIVLVILVLLALIKAFMLKQIWDQGVITMKFQKIKVGKINLFGTTEIETVIDFNYKNVTSYKGVVRDLNFKGLWNSNLLLDTVKNSHTAKIEIKPNSDNVIPVTVKIFFNKDTLKLLVAVLAGKREVVLTETRFSLFGIPMPPYPYSYNVSKSEVIAEE